MLKSRTSVSATPIPRKSGNINYYIIKSDRKSISLRFDDKGQLIMRCPFQMTDREADNFIIAKSDWIYSNKAAVENAVSARENFKIEIGGTLPLMRKDIPVFENAALKCAFDGSCFRIPRDADSENIRRTVVLLYKQIARDILTQRTIFYSQLMKTKPVSIKINSAKTRWGSCSAKDSINYSWRIVMSNQRCVDYVVVHELCHTFEHNHSDAFWRLVEKFLPDYKEREAEIRAFEKVVNKQNWD